MRISRGLLPHSVKKTTRLVKKLPDDPKNYRIGKILEKQPAKSSKITDLNGSTHQPRRGGVTDGRKMEIIALFQFFGAIYNSILIMGVYKSIFCGKKN